jgi:hypothetical protein
MAILFFANAAYQDLSFPSKKEKGTLLHPLAPYQIKKGSRNTSLIPKKGTRR